MNNFKDLVDGLAKKDLEPKEYFNDFFTKNNLKNYEIDSLANKYQAKAIKTMFESKKDLDIRIDNAFKIDPFCIEAFFAYFILNDDVFVNYRFNSYYDQYENYVDFDAYQKKCYIAILDFFVEFLLDIHNITKAIKVQKTINRLTKIKSGFEIERLALMYSLIEDSDEFYRLYLDNDFSCYNYLLLLITLLKNDEEIKAKQVLEDMFKNIEYAEYLDHLWDLDLEDPKQKSFYDEVDHCFDGIASIPDFFSWVNNTKENMR